MRDAKYEPHSSDRHPLRFFVVFRQIRTCLASPCPRHTQLARLSCKAPSGASHSAAGRMQLTTAQRDGAC